MRVWSSREEEGAGQTPCWMGEVSSEQEGGINAGRSSSLSSTSKLQSQLAKITSVDKAGRRWPAENSDSQSVEDGGRSTNGGKGRRELSSRPSGSLFAFVLATIIPSPPFSSGFDRGAREKSYRSSTAADVESPRSTGQSEASSDERKWHRARWRPTGGANRHTRGDLGVGSKRVDFKEGVDEGLGKGEGRQVSRAS